MMYRLVLQKSVTVTGVSDCSHITRVTSDRVWISDLFNLILTNTAGDKLHHLTDIDSGYGVHTVTRDGDLIYIDSHGNINKLSTDHRVQTTLIKYNTAPWRPQCVYSSPSTGDLLVGMFNTDTNTAQVNRYNNTGLHIQTIQHDNNTGQRLYSLPVYITENRNGDVIVSDYYRGAVVVTDQGGRHRFSYTGPPSGSGLEPRGICTDALSHILVCDPNTHTVQMIDKDGQFLSLIQTSEHGIDRPHGLSYDDITNLLWVGSRYNNTVYIYRLINGGDNLTAPNSDDINEVDELKKFLRKEKTTVSHARGILVGCAEAGKTTLLKRLRRQRQNISEATKSSTGITTLLKRLRGKRQNVSEVTESTRGLEVHQHLFIVKDEVLEVTDDDSPLKTFIRINAADLKPDPNNAVDSSDTNGKEDNLELGSTDKITEVVYSREEKKEENVEMSSSPTEGTEEETTVEVMASLLSSEAPALVKDEIFQKILSDKEKLPTVSMLDFAGQLAYYACHQIYVTPKAFFILVLDMTKRFEDVVSKEKDNQEGSIFSVWTNKDYLKFWITSMKTFGGKKAPLFLVATHTEKKSTYEIEKYFREFWNAVPDEDRDWLSESLNDREYAVGLMEQDDETTRNLESMKKSIVKLFTDENNTKIELPSSWTLMEQLLYEGAWKVLSLGEIWRLNSSLPNEYRIKSDEEMSKFLKCLHDNGFLLYFKEGKLGEHVILDIQWFANAFSKIIADENHINKDCKRKLIKEWKSFNKTGELKDKVIDALWKDEPSYSKHKSEILSYMEKLQMLVPLNAIEAVSEGDMSWYVPCMNKKQFKADFFEDKWECSSILCFRFTSFAMFVFYRLVAYCISFLKWSVAKDEDNEGSPCLYQTAAVFDHNAHTVVVGICNDDIQLQVLRIKPLTVDKDVSNEIGDSIDKAVEELTETFIDTKIFHRGYKCQNIICKEKDLSFTLASELSKIKAKETQCKCQFQEKHVINVQTTLGFWEKNPVKYTEAHRSLSQSSLDSFDAGESASGKFQKLIDNSQRSKEPETLFCEEWHKSVGHLVCSDGTAGTAFRVGSRYLMTAYHVIRKTLEMYIYKIIENVQSDPLRRMNYLRLLQKLQVEESGRDIEEKLRNGVHEWLKKTSYQLLITSLLSALEDTGFSCAKDKAVNFIEDNPIYVYFGRTREQFDYKRYRLRYDIPFFSKQEADDVALLEVNWTNLPKPFILDISRKRPENITIIGHPASHGNEQIIDRLCPLISECDAFQTHCKALSWWKRNYPKSDHKKIKNDYDSMFRREKVLFHCSESTTHGASGGPGIFDLDKGLPKVYLMLQEGIPGFVHNVHDTSMKEILRICPKECLVESGISMSRVYELLSSIPQLKELRDNIFHT
ncbi:uncharacterized protein LOC133195444 [Saccostrea echinata]|uniref:uncharacterized protein LOC133195444 n=1 Tax=Saccostrea echinata TaxID=191078 RepID=UPI002A811803|nr:uncharacterized protein LOC133195444 [Saccostrea echinata]